MLILWGLAWMALTMGGALALFVFAMSNKKHDDFDRFCLCFLAFCLFLLSMPGLRAFVDGTK